MFFPLGLTILHLYITSFSSNDTSNTKESAKYMIQEAAALAPQAATSVSPTKSWQPYT